MAETGSEQRPRESWNSRVGVILAVAGSAIGLGNFLRFPGQAAEYGGGAFMIAYFISFLLLGLPICWAEWAMGRRAGQLGFNSCPAIFTIIARRPWAKYLGIIGVVIPVVIYMYYVNIEAWCLGYSMNFLAGKIDFSTTAESGSFFGHFVGVSENGEALGLGFQRVAPYLLICFLLNFVLIYRGLSKGIELFCIYAMPTLLILGFIVLVRVLTLGTPNPEQPYNNVNNGLGFMWNPNKVILEERVERNGREVWVVERELVGPRAVEEVEPMVAANPNMRIREQSMLQQLAEPRLWLAAAGQIFFSLSIGFGVVLTYASYLKKDDDIVLSGLSAASANEFAEVGLGGLITLPAGVAFFGAAGIAGQSTFGLGFNVLPLVFSEMAGGAFFGFAFFFLLFLAAITSSISMLQPGIAFLEEALFINRRQSVAILGLLTALGAGFVFYFSQDVKALDTLDFWVGTFMIYCLAMIQIILFAWVLGVEKGFKEAHQGATVRIPSIFKFVMQWISPVFLLLVFAGWFLYEVLNIRGGEVAVYISDLFQNPHPTAILSVGLILLVATFVALVLSGSYLFSRVARDAEEKLP